MECCEKGSSNYSSILFPGVTWGGGGGEDKGVYNNNNVHLSCAHQRPEHSHDTY